MKAIRRQGLRLISVLESAFKGVSVGIFNFGSGGEAAAKRGDFQSCLLREWLQYLFTY